MLGGFGFFTSNNLCATSSKSLVPHGRGITAGPGQDGIALLGVLGQEVGQVVDGAVEGLGAKWFSRIGSMWMWINVDDYVEPPEDLCTGLGS